VDGGEREERPPDCPPGLQEDLLFQGELRFADLAAAAEGVPTNTLADRLRRLEERGIVAREAYSDRPVRYRYRLTDRGRDLAPILDAMGTWGVRHLPGTRKLTLR